MFQLAAFLVTVLLAFSHGASPATAQAPLTPFVTGDAGHYGGPEVCQGSRVGTLTRRVVVWALRHITHLPLPRSTTKSLTRENFGTSMR